ncbi:MAG: SRPBCC family protein [Pseudomonadota bacterium]
MNSKGLSTIGVGFVLMTLVGCAVITGGGETVDGNKHMRSVTVERELPFSADLIWERVMMDYGGAEKFNPKVVRSGYLGEVQQPIVGAQRYMYYNQEGSEGLHEQLVRVDPQSRSMRFDIIEAREVPVDTSVSFGQSQVIPLGNDRAKMQITLYFRTTPRFLALFASGQIRSDMSNMLAGIEYFLATGKPATPAAVATLTQSVSR